MRDLTLPRPEYASGALDRVPEQYRERVLVEHDPETGPRLKYFSRAADVAYWTTRWQAEPTPSYARELQGHLPHQLRDTFRRWVKPGARTLEAGCGLGHFTVATHALGYVSEGLDWSGDTIERLRRRFPRISWHVGDARLLQFETGSFDAVYSPGVCEHFEEGPVAVLAEAHRVLRCGGFAIISTPCFNEWLQHHEELLPNDAPEGAAFFEYAFTTEGLAALLERLGFAVVQVRPYGALDTLTRYGGWRIPERLQRICGFLFDYVPVVRHWGSTCIWVARKR